MKIFPTDCYTFELTDGVERNLAMLRSQTFESSRLSSQVTSKPFIGEVGADGFRLIGSSVGIGAFTIFLGKIDSGAITVNTEVNRAFKILASFIVALAACVIGARFIVNGFMSSIGLLVPLAMIILFVRFVMIGLFYRVSRDLTLEKLVTMLA